MQGFNKAKEVTYLGNPSSLALRTQSSAVIHARLVGHGVSEVSRGRAWRPAQLRCRLVGLGFWKASSLRSGVGPFTPQGVGWHNPGMWKNRASRWI